MLRVRQIRLLVSKDSISHLKNKVASKLHILPQEILKMTINKKAIDARNKKEIFYTYEIDVKVVDEEKILKNNNSLDIFKVTKTKYVLPQKGREKLTSRIVIVGAGPAGLFAAYLLAEAGFKPLVIERGKMIDERVKDVEAFWQNGLLNSESNVQFGEGGAGTFSDGKLNTLVKDKENLSQKVFDIFISCGAPDEIKYLHNPHIGTDNLRQVIKRMRNKIIAMGGEFRYETKLTDIVLKNKQLTHIIVNGKEKIACQNLILALGHSARDTFKMLYTKDIRMVAKAFAVGVRIMHPQELIDKNQYGSFAKFLPPASYKLTYTTKDNRGIYSFCMCPGGYVVNASSEVNKLAINGMSNYKRDSQVANSALIVTVTPEDFGASPLDGIKFQQDLETKAYNLAQGKIPLQTWQDFLDNKPSLSQSIPNLTKGAYAFTNIRTILPDFVTTSLLEALPYFDKKIKDFANPSVIIAAIESRTSSPVRIIRDENLESSIKGIYPAGEGAGYAGGITTSAIDGLKVATKLIQKYTN